MRSEEIMCFAVLPEDLVAGLDYAWPSLNYTFDRMKYGDDRARRFYKIALGKACEATLIRYLRQHGIPHLSRQGSTHHTQPDRFDLSIMKEVVDLKTFRIHPQKAEPKYLLDCLALVPDHHANDQWARRKHYDRYIFGFFENDLQLRRLAGKPVGKLPIIQFKNMQLEVLKKPSLLYLTAAPKIAECEQQFRTVSPGTVCVQYPRGTRIRNQGCPIRELVSFQSFMDKMYQYRRR